MLCRTCLIRRSQGTDGYCAVCRQRLAESAPEDRVPARCAACTRAMTVVGELAGRACVCSRCQSAHELPEALPRVRVQRPCGCGGTTFARTLALEPLTELSDEGRYRDQRYSTVQQRQVQRMAGVPLEHRACTTCGEVTTYALGPVPVGTEHGTEAVGDPDGPYR